MSESLSSEHLSKDTYIAAVQADGAALADAARMGLSTPVPSCPGWVVADVTSHVGSVYHLVSELIERRATEMVPQSEIPEAPDDASVIPWFEAGHGRVLAALADIAPDEAVWSWSTPNGGFYHRRMAMETLVHRWDAENAHGSTGPVDGDIASNGVSEFYEFVAPFSLQNDEKTPPGGSLHLHRTDGEGEWLLNMAADEVVLTHEHAKGDAAVRARSADLLLLAWGRLALDDVAGEVFGDRAVTDAWFDLSR